MNFLGENNQADFDGTLDADLTVNGNGQINGDLNVTGKLIANSIVGDISTPIITLGLNNPPGDSLNLGYLEESNNGVNDQYSGILRNHVDKRHYVLNGVAPKPTPNDLNITSLPRGDIYANRVGAQLLDMSSWSLEQDLNNFTLKNVGNDKLRISSDGTLYASNSLRFQDGTPNQYIMPANSFGANHGDVLKFNSTTKQMEFKEVAVSGESTWGDFVLTGTISQTGVTNAEISTAPSGTVSDIGDLQFPSITNGLIKGYTLKVCIEGAVLQDSGNQLRWLGRLDSNNSLLFGSEFASKPIDSGYNYRIIINMSVTNLTVGNLYNVKSVSTFTYGDTVFQNTVTLNNIDGTIDQPFTIFRQFLANNPTSEFYLENLYMVNVYGKKLLADGATNPFDQNLNTTDNVTFNSVEINNSTPGDADLQFKVNGFLRNTIKSVNGGNLIISDPSGIPIITCFNDGVQTVQISNQMSVQGDIMTVGSSAGLIALFRNNVSNSCELIYSGGGDSIYAGRPGGSEGYRIRNNTTSQDLLSITHDTKETTTHGLLKANAGIEVDNGDAVVKDGNCLRLGDTSDVSTMKCVNITLIAGEALNKGYAVKIINDGGIGKVQTIKATDPDTTGVIGITASDALLNEDVDICVGGIFSAVVQNGTTITPGDLLEKSDTVGQDGRVYNPSPSVGTFAVALTQGVGDAGGTVQVRGLFIKNESF